MKNIFDAIGKSLRDIKPFSGQALILLSLFSWLMSVLVTNELVEDLLARMGWLFLTVGLGWVLSSIKQTIFGITIYPGPWITGALACGFIFYGWTNDLALPVIIWPLVSAIIATVPKFLKYGTQIVDPRIADAKKFGAERQQIIMRLVFSAVLSCWFQFYFLVQDWIHQYPSLLVDDFQRSAFVFKLQPVTSSSGTSRGVLLLNLTETVVRDRLESIAWSDVERWLLNVDREIATVRAEVMEQIPDTGEDDLWLLQAETLPGNPGYILQLRIFWQGPSSRPQGYYVEKLCDIVQVPNRTVPTPRNAPTPTVARVTCQPAQDQIWIEQSEGERT